MCQERDTFYSQPMKEEPEATQFGELSGKLRGMTARLEYTSNNDNDDEWFKLNDSLLDKAMMGIRAWQAKGRSVCSFLDEILKTLGQRLFDKTS